MENEGDYKCGNELCQELWLAVIKQAISDSLSDDAERYMDLPEVIESAWWIDVFCMAGLSDGAMEMITSRIRSALNRKF